MVKYPESDNWNDLSNCIKGSNLSNSLAATVTSTSTTREENEILKKSLYESASSRAEKAGTTVEDDKIVQSLVDQPDALVFQDIDLKHSYKEGQIGCERTKNLLDKSWYLNNIVLKTISFDYLLGELQLGFLLMLLLANFSSAQQWLKIVDLLTRCESDLQHNPTRYSRFVKIISSQLNNCPQEYIESFLEPPRLEKAFSNFYADSPCLTNMNQLKSTLQRIGIQLSESEEDPEDQPVIVDMS
jgi:A1 cistron-splicing factor AAR2